MFEINGFSRNLTLQYSLTKQLNIICVQHLGGLDISWPDKEFFKKSLVTVHYKQLHSAGFPYKKLCGNFCVWSLKKKKERDKTCKYYISLGNIIILQTTPAQNFWAMLIAPLHRSPYTFLCKEREYWSWYSVGGSKEGYLLRVPHAHFNKYCVWSV